MLLDAPNGLRSEHSIQDREACLASLAFVRAKQLDRSADDTFKWVWSNESFKRWLQTNSGPFWIQGKAGSGKSTLMKYIFGKERTKVTKPPRIVAEFSFFDQAEGPESSMKGLFRSLLYQVLRHCPLLSDPVLDEYKKQKDATKRKDAANSMTEARFWEDLTTLQDLLIATLDCASSGQQFCFFVDSLDECRDSTRQDVEFLIQKVARHHSASRSSTKVCMFSRPNPELSHFLRDIPTIALDRHNQGDIKLFLTSEARSFEPLDAAFKKILEQIVDKANGLFLWAKLIWSDFISPELEAATIYGDRIPYERLCNLVSRLPRKLEDIYKSMLSKIDGRYQGESARMLQMVLCAGRPFRLEEFPLAWAFGSPAHQFASLDDAKNSQYFEWDLSRVEKQIRGRCGGLVETKEVSDEGLTVQVIHQSVKEYLETLGDMSTLFEGIPKPENGHDILLRACTNLLSTTDIRTLSMRKLEFYSDEFITLRLELPMLGYSTSYWLYHLENAELATGRSQAASLQNNSARQMALSNPFGFIISKLPFPTGGFTFADLGPLSVASGLNITCSARDLLQNGVDANEAGGFPLHAAAASSLHSMMLLLLEHGANLEGILIWGVKHRTWNPISYYILNFDFTSPTETNAPDTKTDQTRVINALLEQCNDNKERRQQLVLAVLEQNRIPLLTRLLADAKHHHYFHEYVQGAMITVVFGERDQLDARIEAINAILASLEPSAHSKLLDQTLDRILLFHDCRFDNAPAPLALHLLRSRKALGSDASPAQDLNNEEGVIDAIRTYRGALTPI
jgi:NACHT domain